MLRGIITVRFHLALLAVHGVEECHLEAQPPKLRDAHRAQRALEDEANEPDGDAAQGY